MSRETDHKNIDLEKFNLEVVNGEANGKIIWQPRILCWYDDKKFAGQALPKPYTDMTLPEIYMELGCSNRIYDYNGCFKCVEDSSIKRYTRKLSELTTEHVAETPVGTINTILRANTSNNGQYPEKWWVESEEDLKVIKYIVEHQEWEWNQEHFDNTYKMWGNLGAPTMFMPRVNIQHLYLDIMGAEEAIYSLMDYPEAVEEYFESLEKNHERLIKVINESPLKIINFGDNLHCAMLPPEYFEKYIIPTYQRRCKLLHEGNKFICSHWDGDTKGILKYAKDCGLDGIEAITPFPQGDVTLEEVKEALGDDIWLIDGIAALLFNESYPEEELIKQVNQCIELFAPKLILGISDELSSIGNIERVRLVRKIVDDYNAKVEEKNRRI